MGHSTKITLYGTHFESRTALRAHLRRIRNRWHGKGAISGRDNDFLLGLFSYHPEASSIAPSGVSHFEVHLAPERGEDIPSRPCLWAVSDLGSMTPVSMEPAVKVAYQRNPYHLRGPGRPEAKPNTKRDQQTVPPDLNQSKD